MSDTADSDGFFSESESGEALIAAQTAQNKAKGMASSSETAADPEAPKTKTAKKRSRSPAPEHIAGAILGSAAKRKPQEEGLKGCGAAVAASTSRKTDTGDFSETPNTQPLSDRGSVPDQPGLPVSNPDRGTNSLLTPELPLRFSDNLVLRQLRYTGMLETVRIRQSGYSCKYSFQDFVDHFHVLLPRGILPSKQNIQDFFRKKKISLDNYQVGRTMVFMKEQQRQLLQGLLHQEVVRRITLLQSWFRAMLYRRHFLNMKQAAVVIQRYWRSYQRRKRAEAEDSLNNSALFDQAAIVLQSHWRGYVTRRKFQQMRVAGFIIQSYWRECLRRRHAAATFIQATWRSYCSRSLYRIKRDKVILLQAAYRGYKTRQRYRTLKQQKLQEAPLGNGPTAEGGEELEREDSLDVRGSDPSEWEDCSFEERERMVEERKSVMENKGGQMDPSDNSGSLPYKHHERASSQSGVNAEEQVVVRERPMSLEDLNPKKGVRAKRESRRMRELEQAIFSLELLKVRSTGGTSPSEERQWSPEPAPEGMQSPRGTPESGSSQGSLEMLIHEETQKNKLDPLLPQDYNTHSVPGDSLPNSPKSDDEQGITFSADVNRNVSDRKRSIPSSESPECLPAKERLACDSRSTVYHSHTREPLISSSLPTFYLPPQDNLKAGHSVMENNLRNKQMDMSLAAKQDTELQRAGQIQTSPKASQSPSSGEDGQFLAASETFSSDPIIKRLEKLNVEKEERRKQKQLQNEKEMMEQIRQQKEILEKERKAFEELQRQDNEQNKARESSQGTSARSPKKTDGTQSLLIGNPPNKGERYLAKTTEPMSVDIKGLTVSKKGSPPARVTQKERMIVLTLERRESQPPAVQEPAGLDRLNSQMSAESQDGSSNQPARKERFRLPRIPNQGTESTSSEARVGPIFFTPKDSHKGIK
ncbi:UNVERIFIED_CONTAM: hypothetical protein K2H54_015097 [Gekko kuhli]